MEFINKTNINSNLIFLRKTKNIFILIGFLCFVCLLRCNHPTGFQSTILLPIFYIINTYVFVGNKFLQFGLGSFSLVMFYCVRMCIFPLIIAYGHYYLEPPDSVYIEYYGWSILLMGIENFIVFLTVKKYINKYYSSNPETSKTVKNNNDVIFICLVVFTIIPFTSFYLKGIDYYHLLTEESAEDVYIDEIVEVDHSGILWYISDYISGLWRILISIWCIVKGFKKWPNQIFPLTILVVFSNMFFLSDRRIFALIVSIYCLFYYLRNFATNKTRKIMMATLIIAICMMAYFYTIAYANQGGAEMISRTIQRYFSGPSISAIALRINSDIGVVPGQFIRLFFNDFQSLSGLFGKMTTIDYVEHYFYPSRGIWTPFMPGSIRYFGILFPIPLIFCGWCIVKWDCLNRKTDDYMYSMIYSYISFSISFYLIMYTLELVLYFIIATGGVLSMMIHFDRTYKLKRYNLKSY